MARCAVCHRTPCRTPRECETIGMLARHFYVTGPLVYSRARELFDDLSARSQGELRDALLALQRPERPSEAAIRLMHEERASHRLTTRERVKADGRILVTQECACGWYGPTFDTQTEAVEMFAACPLDREEARHG